VNDEAIDGLYGDHVRALDRAYAEILAEQGWDAVAIHSGAPVRKTHADDQFWPLRPTPAFQHWAPLAEGNSVILVRPGFTPKLLRTPSESFWERPPAPETEAYMALFDVVSLRGAEAARPSFGSGRVAFIGEESSGAAAASAHVNPPALVTALDTLRVKKSPYEAACIAEANRRARAGHESLRDLFAAGDHSELDLHLAYLAATAQDDPETPYKNIVALGANAATLHHVAYGRRPAKREAESLLVDAGATARGYASDITRTWVKGQGSAADVFGALIAGIEAMQQRLCASIEVGRPYESLHDESHRLTAAVLLDCGLVRGSVDEIVASGVTRAFYPHGLGHSLGLQTHDVGCALRKPRDVNPYLRNTSDTAIGQVFTIEPGVYFIDQLLDRVRAGPNRSLVDWGAVAAVAPLGGVRIEDDVMVEGHRTVRNLTREHIPVGGGALK